MVVERRSKETQSIIHRAYETVIRTWEITKLSFLFLKSHRELALFPILSAIALLILIASFLIPTQLTELYSNEAHVIGDSRDNSNPIITGLWLISYYFIGYFIVIFFNAGLVSCTLMSISGEKVSIKSGLALALTRLNQIISWAFISALLGIFLAIVEKLGDRFGEAVSSLVGTVWSLIAYFVLPTLIVEGAGPINAIKRSSQIFRDTWGEAIGGTVSFELIWVILLIPIGIFLAATDSPEHSSQTLFLMIFVPYLFFTFIIISTLRTIYGTLLYACATGNNGAPNMDISILGKTIRASYSKHHPDSWP